MNIISLAKVGSARPGQARKPSQGCLFIMNLRPYLTFARQLAYRAGRITLSHYNKGIQHDLKQDESPVTAADQATSAAVPATEARAYSRPSQQ